MLAQFEIRKEALNLPARERIKPAIRLWHSLEPENMPVPDRQRDLFRDRLAVLEDIPPEGRSVPWETVRQRLFSDRP